MKKNIIHHILAIALTLLLYACNTAEIDTAVSDELISVPIHFSGEVSISESPLTRAESNDDLYGIQVYQNGTPYAYGLFDDVSDVKLYCHSGREYSFKYTMIRNGKQIVKQRSGSGGDSYSQSYNGKAFGKYFSSSSDVEFWNSGYIFVCGTNLIDNYDSGKQRSSIPVSNCFIYSSVKYMSRLTIPVIINQAGNLTQYIERYYGEADHFIPSGPLTLELKCVSFKLQYSVSGITDGSLSVNVTNSNHTFFNDSGLTASYTSPEVTYCFDNITGAWQYADNYTENLTVHMVWTRGVGIVQDLGSQVIQVKRNADNVINIALDTN